jgi:hypothetical protein
MARQSSRIGLTLGLLLLVAAFAIGCGGSGDDDSTSSLTKAQFIKRGDTICRKTDNEQLGLLVEWNEGHSQEEQRSKAGEAATIEAVFLPPLKTELAALVALGAPSEGEELVDQLTSGLEETVDAVEDDPLGIQTYEQEIAKPLTDAARKYGFRVCSQV